MEQKNIQVMILFFTGASFIILLVILATVAFNLYRASISSPVNESGIGQFCGGVARIQCPEGLICQDSTQPYADAGGICVSPNLIDNIKSLIN